MKNNNDKIILFKNPLIAVQGSHTLFYLDISNKLSTNGCMHISPSPDTLVPIKNLALIYLILF